MESSILVEKLATDLGPLRTWGVNKKRVLVFYDSIDFLKQKGKFGLATEMCWTRIDQGL